MQARRGSAVIEVLLALSLAAFLVASLGNLISSVRRLEQSGSLRQQALTHARYALELVTDQQHTLFGCSTASVGPGTCTRADGQVCTLLPAYQSCWTSFAGGLTSEGPLHLVESGGVWQLVSGSETVDSVFTRSLNAQTLSRDAGGNLVTSGGTPDPNTKRVTVTVAWPERGEAKSLSVSSILTGWASIAP